MVASVYERDNHNGKIKNVFNNLGATSRDMK